MKARILMAQLSNQGAVQNQIVNKSQRTRKKIKRKISLKEKNIEQAMQLKISKKQDG